MSNRLLKSPAVDQTCTMRWPFTGREAELELVGETLADGDPAAW